MSGHKLLTMAMIALSGVLAYARWSLPAEPQGSPDRQAGPFADWGSR